MDERCQARHRLPWHTTSTADPGDFRDVRASRDTASLGPIGIYSRGRRITRVSAYEPCWTVSMWLPCKSCRTHSQLKIDRVVDLSDALSGYVFCVAKSHKFPD